MLAIITYRDVAYFGFLILGIFGLLMGSFLLGFWLSRRQVCPSPYTGLPLRRGSDLSYGSIESILRYLYHMHQYDNRMFDLNHAAYCRETGRVFPNAIGWLGIIRVDWNFLQKRYPGNYVSWGSLTDMQKEMISHSHHSLSGYQTDLSSPEPSPRKIEPEFAFAKPGPLYVDLETRICLGWKCVPDTDFEVLIVQKPRGIFEQKKGTY